MAEIAVLITREVADLLKVDSKTVYRLVRGNRLPGFKVAGTLRFKNADIDQWIEKQKKAVGRGTVNEKQAVRKS